MEPMNSLNPGTMGANRFVLQSGVRQTYGPPEGYNPIDWQDFTTAQWEPIMEIIEELDDDDNNNGGY